jgi:hypothetical protein
MLTKMSNVKEEYDPEWNLLLDKLTKIVGKRPNLDAVLFLIGIQELGKGKQIFSKEEKQDLMHIAVCRLLSQCGYYELEGLDKDGWPHWKLVKKLPKFDLEEQEKLLKIQIKEYFSDL